MGSLTGLLLSRFRAWDRPSQVSFLLAVVFLTFALAAAAYGPPELRQPATIGVIGLVIMAQVIFMWANRGMVTPFTLAQRHYMHGEFDAAREILEALWADGTRDVQALTLLGNTYRQLGLLDESEAVLYEAVNKHPNHYFPLYGFGRTLLVQGDYEEAAQSILKALELGAPVVVSFDVGEAFYRGGNLAMAVDYLRHAASNLDREPHRALMAAYLLYRLNAGAAPSAGLIRDSLAYWQAQAELYHFTPYGMALAADIEGMQLLMEEV
jgi:tetratricopeptide (TPR) repeat protein